MPILFHVHVRYPRPDYLTPYFIQEINVTPELGHLSLIYFRQLSALLRTYNPKETAQQFHTAG